LAQLAPGTIPALVACVLAEAAPLDKELVPETALIREFIGDSVYHR